MAEQVLSLNLFHFSNRHHNEFKEFSSESISLRQAVKQTCWSGVACISDEPWGKCFGLTRAFLQVFATTYSSLTLLHLLGGS